MSSGLSFHGGPCKGVSDGASSSYMMMFSLLSEQSHPYLTHRELEPEVGRYDGDDDDLGLDEAGQEKEPEEGDPDDCDDGNSSQM